MNVVYIHSHDTGRRIAPHGYAVDTPNLSRLADKGTLFRQAFCAAPTCSPSRAALLTGQSAHASGMLGLNHRGFTLSDPSQHLASFLQGHGYDTTLVGVNHVGGDVAELGYKRVVATDSSLARDVGPAAADFLASRPTTPFFLDVGFVETHRGRFVAPEHLDPRDRPDRQQPPDGLPDVPETRLDSARFATAVRAFDEGVGRVLDALDEKGLADNTLVIATTDHGVSFPGHKCTCRDGGLGVFLILRGPGVPRGATSDALVSQIDLFPTLCDRLGLDRPAWLTGQSLAPLLDGTTSEVNDAIFGEVTYHAAYEPQRAIRTKRWKLIRRFGDRRRPVPSNSDDGPSKNAMRDAGWFERPHPDEALYDLLLDPAESNDLAGEARHGDVLADLRARLDAWMRETGDPLLDGPVPPPPGAAVNRPDDLSPGDPPQTAGSPA